MFVEDSNSRRTLQVWIPLLCVRWSADLISFKGRVYEDDARHAPPEQAIPEGRGVFGRRDSSIPSRYPRELSSHYPAYQMS
jgi:hypothetical protein